MRAELVKTADSLGDRGAVKDLVNRSYDDWERGRVDRKNAADLVAMATIVRRDNNWEDANSAFRGAVRADPRRLEANLEWGELFLEKHAADQALACFRDVLARDPGNPDAQVGHGPGPARAGGRQRGGRPGAASGPGGQPPPRAGPGPEGGDRARRRGLAGGGSPGDGHPPDQPPRPAGRLAGRCARPPAGGPPGLRGRARPAARDPPGRRRLLRPHRRGAGAPAPLRGGPAGGGRRRRSGRDQRRPAELAGQHPLAPGRGGGGPGPAPAGLGPRPLRRADLQPAQPVREGDRHPLRAGDHPTLSLPGGGLAPGGRSRRWWPPSSRRPTTATWSATAFARQVPSCSSSTPPPSTTPCARWGCPGWGWPGSASGG